MYSRGEVWFVEFPLEEDNTQTINRPVIVLDENTLGVLSVKITKHEPRKEDSYDVPILYWKEANLRLASTARVSKVTILPSDSFIFKIGELHQDDLDRIEQMYEKYLANYITCAKNSKCV
jgi:mRNA-degrading endonuclease toxin of MazEF toxin-antitoxin module